MNRRRRNARAFTLIELIAVMTVSGILAAVVWRNVSRPIEGFVDVSRRAALVDKADTALNRMTREIRLALPNSVRVGAGGTSVEFLRTRTGGRYRAVTDPVDPTTDALDFTLAVDDFDVLGPLQDFGGINSGGGGLTGCLNGVIDCIVVFNTGNPANCDPSLAPNRTNAYCGDNMAGVDTADTATSVIRFDRSDVMPNTPFPFGSPNQRFHIVDTPVSFVCDIGAQTLMRYAHYPIGTALFTPPGGVANLLADRITDCSFNYDPGSATRAGLVTLRVTLADDDAPQEKITLLQQIHVPNVP